MGSKAMHHDPSTTSEADEDRLTGSQQAEAHPDAAPEADAAPGPGPTPEPDPADGPEPPDAADGPEAAPQPEAVPGPDSADGPASGQGDAGPDTGAARGARRPARRRVRIGRLAAIALKPFLDAPRGASGRPRWYILVPVLTAAAVAVGGGGYLVSAALVHPPAYGPLWSVPTHVAPAAHATGSWLLDTEVVRGRAGGLLAYDQLSGEEAWRLPLPGRGSICAMSEGTSGGVGAVVYGNGGSCGSVMAVDVRTGRELWHQPVPASDSEGPAQVAAVVVQPDLVVASHSAGTVAFPTEGGDPSWTHSTDCPVTDLGVGRGELLLVTQCADQAPMLVELDRASGEQRGAVTAAASSGAEAFILHVRPTVLAIRDGGLSLVSMDGSGRERAQIPASREFGTLSLDGVSDLSAGAAALPFLVNEDTLIAKARGDDKRPMVVAFRLGTGEKRWQATFPGEHRLALVHAPGSDSVRVFDYGRDGGVPRLLRFASDGSTSVAATFARNLSGLPAAETVLGADGRLFFVSGQGMELAGNGTLSLVALGKPARSNWPF